MRKIVILLCVLFSIAFSANMQSSMNQQDQSSFSMIPAPTDLENQINPEEYIIGVGDQFIIEKIQEKKIYTVPVLPSGLLAIPGHNTLNVGGLTLKEVENIISKELGPYSNVSLYDIKNIRIPVSGAVYNAGIHTISAAYRLSDLLKKTPLISYSKDFAIEIRGKDSINIVNIYEFFLNGDLKNNPYLHAGESVHIPFADVETECIQVYGPIQLKTIVEYGPEEAVPVGYNHEYNDKGLIPIIPGETLEGFIKRKIQLSEITAYDEIGVVRDGDLIPVANSEFKSFVLQPKDRVEFKQLPNIMVSGHVNRPGTFGYIPGFTVMDYISIAGGVNYKGSFNSALVMRGKKKFRNIEDLELKRGDIIIVKRSSEDIFIGETSVLQFISMIASIASTVITAFIAAGSL